MRRVAVMWLAATFCCAGADPVLQVSTYLGGSGREPSAQVAVAPDGAIWIALATNSTDLPASPDAAQPKPGDGFDVFLARLSPSGEILRATYFGGSGDESPSAIQLDTAGNVWLAGSTASAGRSFVARLSSDLRAIQQSVVVPVGATAGFVVNSTGAAYVAGDNTIASLTPSGELSWLMSLGSGVRVAALALDAAGRPVVAGNIESAELPGGGARYGERAGVSDGFVAKLAADGKSLVWARYVGGAGSELLTAMAQDHDGNLWVAGTISSTKWFDTSPSGFFAEISTDGASVLTAGVLAHDVKAMAIDAAGAIWLTGTCCFPSFEATPTAFQSARNGYATDAYLEKLDNSGATLWASYIGGTGEDRGTALVPTAGGVVVAGVTQSFDFPLNHAAQTSLHQQPDASPVNEDAFVMRFGAGPLGAPSVQPGSIVNAAGYRAGEAAPGSIVSIFGADLAAFVRQSASLPLPTSLAGATVTVNGVAAPLFYVSPSQINAQIPWETAAGSARIQVRLGDALSETRTLPIATASPGLFVDYRGWAAINSPSYSYLRAGDWLTLYATGLGPVDRPVANGAAPGDPLPLLIATPTVTLGSMPLEVTWAGLAPGLAGVYQVNAKLPADIGAGYRYEPLVVRIGDRSSNAGSVGLAGRLN